MIIRNELESDVEVIFEVTRKAFENHPHSDHVEQLIVNALRAKRALTVSLVAEVEGKVAGHIAFSPVAISDGSLDWYGLGPVSVLPGHQKQGIGQALIREGLAQLKALGARGCVLVGAAEYYARFGFRNIPALILDEIPQIYFLALPFGGYQPRGTVEFHPAFSARK